MPLLEKRHSWLKAEPSSRREGQCGRALMKGHHCLVICAGWSYVADVACLA
ncbi:hypothetical protein TIFTF001_027380 [Ficus carica]|uniref:Uncharacterized protein n=1 Tax=Ficus carica TaxID=3494 RepID=A0AA88DMV2_FICCA|nr:hypothetical protein TIFTF001_027380 [Ficus carica]